MWGACVPTLCDEAAKDGVAERPWVSGTGMLEFAGFVGGVLFVSHACTAQFFKIDILQQDGSTELMRGQADLGEVLDCFRLHEGIQ